MQRANDSRKVAVDPLAQLGLVGSVGAVLTASCCALPMVMMLVGLGGAWTGVFARVAAAGYSVAGASALLLAAAWIVALRRGLRRPALVVLGLGTMLSAAAWAILLNANGINDWLIGLMV
jgi:mercuric ion transport protein